MAVNQFSYMKKILFL